MAPTPLTVLTPVPRWWSVWVRFTWFFSALVRGFVQRPLRNLSFIHFAHWSLVRRWPPDPAVGRERAAPRTLMFLTTFDGSSIQYIDAFVRVVPTQIEALYAARAASPGRAASGPSRATSATTCTGSTTPTRPPGRDDDGDRPGARAARPLRRLRTTGRARVEQRALRARVGAVPDRGPGPGLDGGRDRGPGAARARARRRGRRRPQGDRAALARGSQPVRRGRRHAPRAPAGPRRRRPGRAAARPASTSCSPPTSTRRSTPGSSACAPPRAARSTPSSATAPSTPAPRSPPRSPAGSPRTGCPSASR